MATVEAGNWLRYSALPAAVQRYCGEGGAARGDTGSAVLWLGRRRGD